MYHVYRTCYCVSYIMFHRIRNSAQWGLLYTLLTCIAGESVSELTDLYRVSRSIRVNLYYSIPGKTDIYVYISMLKVCKVSGFVSYIYKQHLVYYVKKNTLMNGGDYLLIIPLPRSKISFVLRINILTNNFTS